MPTIPSRFEVTLFKGDREYKGFGSNSLRFDSLQSEDVPGPGSYGSRKGFHEENSERTSWGIRGTGGFASRSTRFGARSMPSMPRAGLGCPGPGAYDSGTALRCVKEHKDFNQAKRSAAFADAEARSRTGAAQPLPGPGHYGVPSRADLKDAPAAKAAFRSTSTRGVDVGEAASMPGPGEYHDGALTAMPPPPQDDSVSANFKPPTQPRIARVHRDLPAADGRTREALGAFADEVGRKCEGSQMTAGKQPGPGHYEQDRDMIWEGRTVGVSGLSSFQKGPKRHDWAPEEVGLMPGPGRYNPKRLDNVVTTTTAASAFNSASERIRLPSSAIPGPAYYAPKLPKDHKSFRLRGTGEGVWLA